MSNEIYVNINQIEDCLGRLDRVIAQIKNLDTSIRSYVRNKNYNNINQLFMTNGCFGNYLGDLQKNREYLNQIIILAKQVDHNVINYYNFGTIFAEKTFTLKNASKIWGKFGISGNIIATLFQGVTSNYGNISDVIGVGKSVISSFTKVLTYEISRRHIKKASFTKIHYPGIKRSCFRSSTKCECIWKCSY